MRLIRPVNPRLVKTHPLAAGLVFAGVGGVGTSALKDAALGNNGVLTNMDPNTDWVFVPELGRWGLDFDGTGEYVRAAVTVQNVCTLAGWIRFRSTTASRITGVNDGSNHRMYMGIYETYTGAYVGAGDGAVTNTGAVPRDTLWHHWALCLHGTSVSLYVDGINTGASHTYTWSGTASYLDVNYNATAYDIDGIISDYMYFHRVLSQSEIADLADPSNVYLSGLIAGRPRRSYFLPSAPTFSAAWALKTNNLIGGGVG